MARDLNKHQCIGRLGKDPELKYTPAGMAVVNISVACGSSWNDKNGQKQERTEWINYVAYDKLAEIIGKYLSKGSKVFLEGELRTRKWQAQDGTDRYTTEIVASEMQMLDSKHEVAQNAPQSQPAQPNNAIAPQEHTTHVVNYGSGHSESRAFGHAPQQQPAGFDSFEDDIPFS